MPLDGRSRVRSAVLAAALAAASGACQGPAAAPTPDELVATAIADEGLPAIAVAVVDGRSLLYERIAGFRKRGDPTPVADDDAFHLGSNTKAMTALIAGTTVDEGLLTLDSTVGDVLGHEIIIGDGYGGVTLTQLLSQTSGLTDLTAAEWDTFKTSADPLPAQRLHCAALAFAHPAYFAPGVAFRYTNLNYIVAGAMVEVATGKSWETLMSERVFGPLEMTHAGIGLPATTDAVDAPWGHPDNVDLLPVVGPAGTAHASLGDLLNYARVYFDDGLGPNGRIISHAMLTEIETPRLATYGLGWFIEHDAANRVVLTHNGSNSNFYSKTTLIPERGAALILLTNSGEPQAWTRVDKLEEDLATHFGLGPFT